MKLNKILVVSSLLAITGSAFAFETAQPVTATPITSVPFVITQEGNYFLPADLVSTVAGAAITVEADEVVIDLNQRDLSAAGAAKSPLVGIGIAVLNHEDCVIQNGDITGFGYIGILFDATNGKREGNLKNEARHLNFNNDTIGVLIVSASLDEVEHCNFDGGSVGIEDVASLGGDRFQQDNFQEQKASEAVNMGIGILTTAGKGTLTEDCLFASESVGFILGSAPDKFRFDSFNSVPTHFIGGVEEGAGDL